MENTEKEMLDMGNHFKKLLDQKNNQINRMSKTIALAYGLTRCIEEDPECASMCLSSLHQYLTLEVERLMNISED
jgi:F0F1-type ATP synthase alpha subunit